MSWYPERRKRLEKVFLRKYHEILKESGINNYSWEEFYDDYRTSIVVLIYFGAINQWDIKARPFHWWSNLERLLCAFEDLNCKELIKDF